MGNPAILHLRLKQGGAELAGLSEFCATTTPSWQLAAGGAYLDLSGTGRLLGWGADGPARVCNRAGKHFPVLAGGAGPTMLCARLASLLTARLQDRSVLLVPRGSVRAFLSVFPVGVLHDRANQARRLQELGVRTLGDLQVVPRSLLRAVFGQDADLLAAEAEGSALARLMPDAAGGPARRVITGATTVRPLDSAVAQAALLDAMALRALSICPGGPASWRLWSLRSTLQGGRRQQATTRCGDSPTLAGWRHLLQNLWKRLPSSRQGLIRLELEATGSLEGGNGQGLLFPDDERARRLATALGLINGKTGGEVRPASEQLLSRWGIRWYGPSSYS